MLDPFVSPPFKKCPRCTEEYFGVLSIHKSSYTKRCAKCSYPRGTKDNGHYGLPDLKKKVIYLDQQIISNMVKSLIPDFSRDIDPFYLKAFKKLDTLSKLQLIVCPDSEFHEDESELSQSPSEHKRLYELLSHGTSFKSKWEILRYQIHEHLKNWLAGCQSTTTQIPIERITYGEIHSWQERFILTASYTPSNKLREELKSNKEDVHEVLSPTIEGWKNAGPTSFDVWYEGELGHWGPNFIGSLLDWQSNMRDMFAGRVEFDVVKTNMPGLALVGQMIVDTLKASGKTGIDLDTAYKDFTSAKSLVHVPFIRLNAMIFAMAANKVSMGMKPSNIKSSFMNDALMAATVLPFCNAIYTENFLASIFREPPLNSSLSDMPKVFSFNSREQFLSYLDKIEADATQLHMDSVKQVYGDDCGKPFIGVFGKKF